MSGFFKLNPFSQRPRPKPTALDDAPTPSASAATADFAIDEHRPMKVVCIGAGYAGIVAGIRCAFSLPFDHAGWTCEKLTHELPIDFNNGCPAPN
jgi:hypothetical protein